MEFYLGTHIPSWLSRFTIPMFISGTKLYERKTLPRAIAPWCLDSGAFSEIATHGKWTILESEYASFADRCAEEIGLLQWVAPMDWMCEPDMLLKTGLSIDEHQKCTTENVVNLRELTDVPVIPVLQGWHLEDYLGHVEQYRQAGIFLESEPTVGLGSVCRRQNTTYAEAIVAHLARLGISLHAFGFKLTGLRTTGHLLKSADSMAWSFNARMNPPLPNHTHKSCAQCFDWALQWRKKALNAIRNSKAAQLPMVF